MHILKAAFIEVPSWCISRFLHAPGTTVRHTSNAITDSLAIQYFNLIKC